MTPSQWWARPRRTLLLVLPVLAAGLALSSCGGDPATSGVAHLGTTTTTTSPTSPGTRGAGSSPAAATSPSANPERLALRYAKCMRAHGVPSFPDPTNGGGFQFARTQVDPTSPQFQAAQAKCKKLMPGGGPLQAGSTTHPSAQEMATMLEIAKCMRAHGISGFPDPTTKVPALTPGIREISDINTVILVFSTTVDTQSSQFARAAAACNFPLHNH